MVSENETPPRADRPVGPPTIEGDAEEIRESEEPIQDRRLVQEESEVLAEDPPIQSETPSEPGRTERRNERGLSPPTIIAVLALVLAGIGILTVLGLIDFGTLAQREKVEPRLASVEATNRSIGQQLDELAVAINRLHEQRQGTAVSAPSQSSGLEEQVQKLEAQVARLSGTLESIGASLKSIESLQVAQQEDARTTANLVTELNSRAKTEPAQSQPVPQSDAQDARREIAGALSRLRQAVQEGRPFAEDLQAIRSVIPEAADPSLVQISAQGIPSREELKRRLRAIADELKATSISQAPATPPAGVWESLKSKAASLVSVRRLGEAQTLDLVATAADLVDQGSLAGAVQVLSSAQEPRPNIIEAWLKDAQARLAAEKGSEELTSRVLEQLGSGS